jgi:hypothetical protein
MDIRAFGCLSVRTDVFSCQSVRAQGFCLSVRTNSIFIVCGNERHCLGLSASICVSVCENGSNFMSV